MSTTAIGGGDLHAGHVFRRSFDILFRNVVAFFGITAIVFLPLLVYDLAFPNGLTGSDSDWFGIFVAGILAIVAQAPILYGAFQQMRQRPVEIAESLQKGLGRAGSVVGTAFCVGLGIEFGLLLFVVPGLILMPMWYVAVPACVIEGIGPFEAMRRSGFLTQGKRWKVFGIALVIEVVSVIAAMALTAALAFTIGKTGAVVGSYISEVVVYSFQGVLVAVLYHDLRVAKEGVDVERIAAVFG